MRKYFLGLLIIIALVVVVANKENKNVIPAEQPKSKLKLADYPFDNLYSSWVDSVFNSLTLDQRIGQLFFAATYSNLGKNHVDAITGLIKKYQIGGLIFFQGGPKRQALLTNRYQELSKTPLLIAMDAEWGLGMRLDSCVSFPQQMALGAIEDMSLIYRMGVEIGQQCKRMGVHLSFSPVVDINNNPLNPVIGTRSFSENAHDVAERSIMYMNGLQEQRILTTAKHFPGHGNTFLDSHFALPVVSRTYAELDSLELYPYKELIHNNLTGVMVAHVNVPQLDDIPNLAASLSRRVVTDILRDSLKFNGLIHTDALNMKGVTEHFKTGEIEVRALEAGVDALLFSNDIPKAIEAVKTAINNGRIDQNQVEMSCRRILAAKEWAGLKKYQPVDTAGLLARLNSPQTELLNRRLVEASLTIVQNKDNILPLKHLEEETTAILITGTSKEYSFLNSLKLYEENDYYFINRNTTKQQENALFDNLKTYSRVIVGLLNTNSNPKSVYGIPSNTRAFIDKLSNSTNVIVCLFAPPYALASFKAKDKMSAIVVGYQATPLVEDYMAQLLYGAIPGKGSMPVSVDSVYRYRLGIQTVGGLRLKYSIPEEINANSFKLSAIDTMVRNAINKGAIPGCQLLVARKGVVFFKKEYGNTRYDEFAEPVKAEHIYDLASVSKIAATLPSVMLLQDKGQFKLKDKLKDYLPETKDSDKENITMIDLLTHQAQLTSHIAYYLQTMEPLDSKEKLLSPTKSATHSIYLGPRTYLNNRRQFKEDFYATSEDGKHHLQVANDLYIINSYPDTVFSGIIKSKLLPKKQYVYSDLGFIILAKIVERLSEQPIDEFVDSRLYSHLGAKTLGFQPLKRFPKERIVPTANDTLFRKQMLHGYVHDENAAVMGGVSGHAGVFGNANDLAKLMQMYLNMGIYGGERFINDETLADYIKAPFAKQDNRRGIGFDKPELSPKPNDIMGNNASQKSFGHTGFTGTMVWMDPENDLLFVFLSNRIHPEPTNNKLSSTLLRARIYAAIVNAIDVDVGF